MLTYIVKVTNLIVRKLMKEGVCEKYRRGLCLYLDASTHASQQIPCGQADGESESEPKPGRNSVYPEQSRTAFPAAACGKDWNHAAVHDGNTEKIRRTWLYPKGTG